MKKRTGAASFYIIAFATLLLTVIAIAFVNSVMVENNRAIDDDLSQSAYDSALAGIEDAKIAIAKYNECKSLNSKSDAYVKGNCSKVIDWMEHYSDDCDVVANILGRASSDSGTFIKETINGNNSDNGMEQAYTCVTLNSDMYDYRASLNSEHLTHVVPLRVNETDKVESIRISWYADTDGTVLTHKDITASGALKFPSLTNTQQSSTPPTIAVELIQTPTSFTMTDLDRGTNRGILYLTPSNKQFGNPFSDANEHPKYLLYETTDGAINQVSGLLSADYYDITNSYQDDYKTNVLLESDAMTFTQSNKNETKNVPILVYCPENSGSEFACSVSIQIPRPTPSGAERNGETFMLAVSLPYGRPDTDFAVEVCKSDKCYPLTDNGTTDNSGSGHVKFNNSQIKIDSTGRANDLYRRVEARVENIDPNFPVPTYAVQLDGKNASMLKTNISSTKSGTPRWDESY